MSRKITLSELAELTGCERRGPADLVITQVSSLQAAGPSSISFLANSRYKKSLADTQAGAVILNAAAAEHFAGARLISGNPYLTFAQVARALNPARQAKSGIHPSAVIDASASVAPSAEIGPFVYIGAGTVIGEQSIISAGTVIGDDVSIGSQCVLHANVTIQEGCTLGNRVVLHPGVVVGGDGFGFAQDNERWVGVPQLGRVILEDEVEIGANSTVDRGSQEDTWIEEGVKIDNLVQIAHNVRIGAHTVIASGTGISGSTKIGRCCTIAGQVGFAGHLEIADHCTFTGKSMVIGNVPEPGIYSSGMPSMPWRDWRKTAVRVKQLDGLARRVEQLEQNMKKDNDDD
ncbi:UDP-3-O-(3-hydroxymyristoyl)glucosamine N-acyltransferase [Spiribacter sp. C176]|uniref:UDP-3-O-acylglucosamine N-acyltransferase n=1 Tax=Spiribacter salilacus TaxID=2664894 RepID=A0A6N7QPA3_9GAMM|nr:UDP-3-O-(3-hydroxymyristoyl)glucosamine N-acyltransferase [Spiribacter salilacus]MRH77213.1 UDP-3-O-(3-hydroxymyristoyl)glucosamine N-acyltransferase [Spiribacter salilacus]